MTSLTTPCTNLEDGLRCKQRGGTPVTHRRSTQNPMWGAGETGILAGREFTPRGPVLEDRAQEHMRIVPLRWLTYRGRKGPVTVLSLEGHYPNYLHHTHQACLGPPWDNTSWQYTGAGLRRWPHSRRRGISNRSVRFTAQRHGIHHSVCASPDRVRVVGSRIPRRQAGMNGFHTPRLTNRRGSDQLLAIP